MRFSTFYAKKWGGHFLCGPHQAEKWGGRLPPPRPPPIYARESYQNQTILMKVHRVRNLFWSFKSNVYVFDFRLRNVGILTVQDVGHPVCALFYGIVGGRKLMSM